MQIPAKALAAVSFAVAKDNQRFMLCGVCVVRHNDRIPVQATNGHILVRADTDSPYPEDLPGEFIFRFTPDQLRDIRKKANAESLVIFEALLTEPTMELNGTVSRVEALDATFPDCARLWPSAMDGKLPKDQAFDARYFDLFVKIEKHANQHGKVHAIRFQHNSAGPTLVEFPCAEVEAIIMPMRV